MKGVADGAGEWVVAIHESGTRLDKFIAAPGRLGSRSRAATALERRKVFLNDVEVGFTQADFVKPQQGTNGFLLRAKPTYHQETMRVLSAAVDFVF